MYFSNSICIFTINDYYHLQIIFNLICEKNEAKEKKEEVVQTKEEISQSKIEEDELYDLKVL